MNDVTATSDPFTDLPTILESRGALAAVDRLIDGLRAKGDFHNLFYAMLMRKRVELGVTPFPMGPSSELPTHTHEPYENAIRDAARHVGQIYLQKRDIPRAWGFYRLIGEPGPIKEALAAYVPEEGEDTYPLVDIAWHQQVLPQKGFDLILDRQGICSTITTVSGTDLSSQLELRNYCYAKLVRTLHEQLTERLYSDVVSRGRTVAAGTTIFALIEANPDLFTEDTYHVDVSHLSSVVQMGVQLPDVPELELARELCEYGRRLSPQFRGDADSPFESTYADYLVYLNVVTGRDIEAGLAHFHGKIARELEEGNTFPAEVHVNLLIRLNRLPEALAAAKLHFAQLTDDRALTCPSVMELSRQVGDYAGLAANAKATGDTVTYLAGLIAAKS